MTLPQPGQVIAGKYRIVRLIGEGGMGAVYEARHEVLDHVVALKFLHADLVRRAGLAARFLQEARVSARIQSSHVTRVSDVDQTADGVPYLVMELLQGESLQHLLDRRRRIPLAEALDLGLQLLAGLEAAHALGVVHRDLKPDNLFLTQTQSGPLLKILDFGIAKLKSSDEFHGALTQAGTLMGTPEYMAPEQLYAAETADHRADLYSTGVILYELLAGARPADGEDAATIIAQVAEGRIIPLWQRAPELPRDLTESIHRAMSVKREDRFPTAHAFRLALLPHAGELSAAGRLAATVHPVAGETPAPPSRIEITRHDAQALPRPIPATLPPSTLPPGAPAGAPARTAPGVAGAAPAYGAAPYGSFSPSPVAGGGASPFPSSAVPAPPPGPRRGARRRGLGWLWALLALAAVAGAAGAGLWWWQESSRLPELPPLPPLGLPTTLVGDAVSSGSAPGSLQPTDQATPQPTRPWPTAANQPTGRPGTNPTPTGSATAAPSSTIPPLTFPSSLPPFSIPSSFPVQIPSSFPVQLPSSFPFPMPATAPLK